MSLCAFYFILLSLRRLKPRAFERGEACLKVKQQNTTFGECFAKELPPIKKNSNIPSLVARHHLLEFLEFRFVFFLYFQLCCPQSFN